MKAMIGETCIVDRQRREFSRNVHFPGEIPVPGGSGIRRVRDDLCSQENHGILMLVTRVGEDYRARYALGFVKSKLTVLPPPLRRISSRCPSCSGFIENHPH
ncbi:unnamed protein product [Sphenostylis stenocarpa]|uniref:Uncharacterized protein n=1 Tax=Sphenostylis stenocarpa TaxID=92480 RepID=A0AA87B614_9FABA|nr:unnamed protein product [Sphenostylis stenocarpa]